MKIKKNQKPLLKNKYFIYICKINCIILKKSLTFVILAILLSCNNQNNKSGEIRENEGKIAVYQVFTRLFGNTKTTNKPWGTIKENGVGKFEDFSDKALQIRYGRNGSSGILELHEFNY